jgi:hypothetical protein
LLKYLSKPGDFLRGDDIFREVQSDLGESAQRCSNEGYEDDKSDIVDKDSDSGMSIVMTAALKKDETSVLDQKQKNRFEEDAKELISRIAYAKKKGEIDRAEELDDNFKKLIEHLKKKYAAIMDLASGKIISYNRVAKGRNLALEETQRNLRRSMEYLKSTQHEGLVNLAEHIIEFLIKNKNIYKPPKDFPSWHIRY